MSRVTELPTKNGRSYMKRLDLQRLILSGTLLLTLGACAHQPKQSISANIPIPSPAPPPQHRILLQEAHSETANLRGEVSSLKILMAKQMGELRSLRNQSQSVHHREQERGMQLQDIRSQLLSSQASQEQLQKHNMELEGQVANIPDTSQLVSDIQSLRGSFQEIINSINGLVSDMRLIKQKIHGTPKKLEPQLTKIPTPSAPATAESLTPDANGHIMIQEGDTLWKLARTYKISVPQIQEWNNLSSDLIRTGRRLKISEPEEKSEVQPPQIKTSTSAPTPAPFFMQNTPMTPAQDNPQPSMETQVDVPSDPTHILSIASPQTDSPESP